MEHAYRKMQKVPGTENVLWGAAPKTRTATVKKEPHKQNILCEGYQLLFSHAIPFMEIMKDEITAGRHASGIMTVLNTPALHGKRLKKLMARNKICFCGSGKKFKNCHG